MKLTSQQRMPAPQKRSEIVARRIVNDIVARGLTPGTPLPNEDTMCEVYDVGRVSLRAALGMLESQSLIKIKPGRGGGAVIGDVSAKAFGRMATLYFQMGGATIRELLEARRIIEPMMCAAGCESASAAQLEVLKIHVAESRNVDLSVDASFYAMSSEFHGIVTSISGNRILDLFGHALDAIFRERIHTSMHAVGDREIVREVHNEIATAILARDASQASAAMLRHQDDLIAAVNRHLPAMLDETIEWL